MAEYKFAYAPKWIQAFTVDVEEVAASTTEETTLSSTFKPAKVNDLVVVWAPSLDVGLVLSPTVVTTAGTVKVRIGNCTVGAIDPASQVFIAAGF